MKTLLKLFFFASILILIVISCKKTLSSEDSFSTYLGNEFNTAYVKNWYFNSFVKSAEFTTNNIKENGKKQPDWRNATYRQVGNMEILEFSLLQEKTIVVIPSDNLLTSADKKKIAAASLKRIVFIKTADNKIAVRELDYVPTWDYLKTKNYDLSDIELGKTGNKFTGRITTKKWSGEILSIRLFAGGKITGRAINKPEKRFINNNKVDIQTANSTETCAEVEVCEWVQHCTYTYEGVQWFPGAPCVEWEDVMECSWQTVCVEGGDDDEEEDEEGDGEPECDYGLSEPCECQLYGLNCNTGGGGNGGGGGGGTNPPVYNPLQPFDNLSTPVDGTETSIISSDLIVSDIAYNSPGPGYPRTIATTTNRNNVEDLQHGLNGNPTGINNQSLLGYTNAFLELKMIDLFHICTSFDGGLQNVGDEMIQKFKNKTGGTYSNPTLNQRVSVSSDLKNFVLTFGSQFRDKLITSGGNINNVTSIDLGNTRPRFNGMFNKFHGLQILINDTEYTEIIINNFSINATSGAWYAEFTITIHDHFGLDKNDALTYQGNHDGFPSWWILQHMRDYVPFETIVILNRSISGHL